MDGGPEGASSGGTVREPGAGVVLARCDSL